MPAPAQLRPRKLLQSWKEIASYLGVTVRTVQRWEKENDLPIHRQGSGLKARVVAYSDELDDWLNRERRDEPEAARTFPWRYVVPAAVVLLAVVTVLIVLFARTPVPAQAALLGDKLSVTAEDGSVCWEKTFRSIEHNYGKRDVAQVVDVDDDGQPEVLLNFVPADTAKSRGRLICYESDGEQRWEFYYGRERTYSGRSFSASYCGHFVRLVQSGGRKYLLTTANHHLWFPSQVALLDPGTGELIDEYWHPGGLFALLIHDLDQDGKPEALLSGVNNPGLGLGYGCLAVLRIPFSPKNSAVSVSPFFDFTQGKELGYFLFPRTDIAVIEGDLPLIDDLAITSDRRVLVRVVGADVHAFYYLDFNLQLVDSRFSDNLVSVHDRLWRMGLLDHPMAQSELESLRLLRRFPTAPDGNGPDVERIMAGVLARPQGVKDKGLDVALGRRIH